MLHLLFTLGCTAGTDEDSGSKADTGTEVVGDATNGETLYASCAGCHNADGSGGVDIGGTPSADHRVVVPAMTDAELEDAIKNGVGTAMPPQYSDAQDVADVIAYLRATFK